MAKALWQRTYDIQVDELKPPIWHWKVTNAWISSLGLLGQLARMTGLDKPRDIILHPWPVVFPGSSSQDLFLTSMISVMEEIQD